MRSTAGVTICELVSRITNARGSRAIGWTWRGTAVNQTRWETSWRLNELSQLIPRSSASIPCSTRIDCQTARGGMRDGSAGGEGASPTGDPASLGEGEGQESIGSPTRGNTRLESTDARSDQDSEAESVAAFSQLLWSQSNGLRRPRKQSPLSTKLQIVFRCWQRVARWPTPVRWSRLSRSTAGEDEALKGAAAGRVGKTLKVEILQADVAWNKATRSEWDQTAERVRNPESGWYWWGKPVQQRSLGLISPKGNRTSWKVSSEHRPSDVLTSVKIWRACSTTLGSKRTRRLIILGWWRLAAALQRAWTVNGTTSHCGHTLESSPRMWESERGIACNPKLSSLAGIPQSRGRVTPKERQRGWAQPIRLYGKQVTLRDPGQRHERISTAGRPAFESRSVWCLRRGQPSQ